MYKAELAYQKTNVFKVIVDSNIHNLCYGIAREVLCGYNDCSKWLANSDAKQLEIIIASVRRQLATEVYITNYYSIWGNGGDSLTNMFVTELNFPCMVS